MEYREPEIEVDTDLRARVWRVILVSTGAAWCAGYLWLSGWGVL